jgi:hypothetical protein
VENGLVVGIGQSIVSPATTTAETAF